MMHPSIVTSRSTLRTSMTPLISFSPNNSCVQKEQVIMSSRIGEIYSLPDANTQFMVFSLQSTTNVDD